MKKEKRDKEFLEDEFEIRFLLPSLPSDISLGILNGDFDSEEIEQAYLPDDGARIRKSTDKTGKITYVYTTKEDIPDTNGLHKKEKNRDISQEEYKEYLTRIEGEIIYKTRYFVPINNFILEINMFHARLEGKLLGEVEFDSLEKAKTFEKPDWIGRDVTLEVSNRRLAMGGDIPRD